MNALTKIIPTSLLLVTLSWLTATTSPAQGQCEEVKLTASDAQDGDHFGDVALSRNLIAVGAIWDDVAAGSVYLYRQTGGTWTEQQKLVASDRASGDSFGNALAFYRDRLVIAAPFDDDRGNNSGSVYVLTRDPQAPGGFAEVKLTASDGLAEDQFGIDVATEGKRIVVGARGDDGAGFAAGSAYVFRLEEGGWVEEAKLLSSDIKAFDIFGVSVAMGGRRIAVGALGAQTDGVRVGAVYVFRRDGGTWIEEAKLVADDPDDLDFLGSAVAITSDGSRIVAGAVGDNENGFDAGAAYVFRRDGTSWSLEAKLAGNDTTAFDQFGFSVAVSGEECAIGAPYDEDQGATYLFRFDGATWNEVAKIEASDETVIDEFGYSVALDPRRLVVGAPLHAEEFGPGAAYVYNPQTCETAPD